MIICNLNIFYSVSNLEFVITGTNKLLKMIKLTALL